MRERQWSDAGREQLTAAVGATFGVPMRNTMRGELRAIGRALEPTERVLAVTACTYEIARADATRRSIAAVTVVTDRRLLFVKKPPFLPARIDEVARTELRDAEMEIDESVRRVDVIGGGLRVTMRNMLGRDVVDSVASAIGAPTRLAPEDEPDAPAATLPAVEEPEPLEPGARLQLAPLSGSGYCIEHDGRVVARMIRRGDGVVVASRAGRSWRLYVRDTRGSWIGVAVDERSREEVASYRARLISGGTLIHEGRRHRLRRGFSGTWRLRAGATVVALMRGEDPRNEIELAAGSARVADPILLTVMLIWADWLEGQLGGGPGGGN